MGKPNAHVSESHYLKSSHRIFARHLTRNCSRYLGLYSHAGLSLITCAGLSLSVCRDSRGWCTVHGPDLPAPCKCSSCEQCPNVQSLIRRIYIPSQIGVVFDISIPPTVSGVPWSSWLEGFTLVTQLSVRALPAEVALGNFPTG